MRSLLVIIFSAIVTYTMFDGVLGNNSFFQ